MDQFYNERFFSPDLSSYAVWGTGVVALLGLIRYNRLGFSQRWVIVYVLFSVVFEYFSAMPWALNWFATPTNYPYFHVSIPFFFAVSLGAFKPILAAIFSPDLVKWLIIGMFAFCCWNAIWGDGIMNFNGKSLAAYSIAMILAGCTYFIYLLQKMNVERPELDPLFWISVGYIIYHAGNFLLWLAVKYINFSRAEFYSIYDTHAMLTFFINGCFCIALLIKSKPKIINTQSINS